MPEQEGYENLKEDPDKIQNGDMILDNYGNPASPLIHSGCIVGQAIALKTITRTLERLKVKSVPIRRKIDVISVESAGLRRMSSAFARDVEIAYEEFDKKMKEFYAASEGFLNNIDVNTLRRIEEEGDLPQEEHERMLDSDEHRKFKELIESGILNEASYGIVKIIKSDKLPLVAVLSTYTKSRGKKGEQARDHIFKMVATHSDWHLRAGMSEADIVEGSDSILVHDIGYLIADKEYDRISPNLLAKTHGFLGYKALTDPDGNLLLKQGIRPESAEEILGHPFRFDGTNGKFGRTGGQSRRVFVSEVHAQNYPSHTPHYLTPGACELRVLEEYVSHLFGDPVAGIEKKGNPTDKIEIVAAKTLEFLINDEGNVDPTILSDLIIHTPPEVLPRRTQVEVSEAEEGSTKPNLMGVIVSYSPFRLFLYTSEGMPLDTRLPGDSLASKNRVLTAEERIVRGVDGKEHRLPGTPFDTYVKLMTSRELGLFDLQYTKTGIVDIDTYNHAIEFLVNNGHRNLARNGVNHS